MSTNDRQFIGECRPSDHWECCFLKSMKCKVIKGTYRCAALSTTTVLRGTLRTAIVPRRGKLSDGAFKQNSGIPEHTFSESTITATPDWVKLGFVAVLVSHCCGCTQRMFLLGMPAIKTISWPVLTRTSLTEFKLELNQNDQLCFDWKYDNNLSEPGPINCTECHHSDAVSTHVGPCLMSETCENQTLHLTCTEADELFAL